MSDYIVLVKQVPDVSQITDNAFDPETGNLIRTRLPSVINELDAQALAFAHRMRSLANDATGKIICLTMGPPMAEAVLRHGLSRCADTVVLLTDRALGGADTWATANPLAFAIRKIVKDKLSGSNDYYIVSGMQSVDGDTAQVPAQIAEEMNVPCIAYATGADYKQGKFEFTRIISGGSQIVQPKKLPVVVTVAKYEYPLFATFAATRRANKTEIIQWGADDVKASSIGVKGSKTRVIRVFPPGKTTRKCEQVTDIKELAKIIIERAAETESESAEAEGAAKGYVLPAERDDKFDRSFEGTAKEAEDFKILSEILKDLGITEVSQIDDAAKEKILEAAGNHFHKKALEDMLAGFENTTCSYDGDVWVVAEHSEEKVHPATFELIGKAHDLADSLKVKVGVAIAGDKVEHFGKELIAAGADNVYVIEDALLKDFDPYSYRKAIADVIKKYRPQIVLYAATPQGRVLAPMVSYRVGCGLTADCTGFDIKDSSRKGLIAGLFQTRPALGGNVMATIVTKDSTTQMATARPGVMKPLAKDESRKGNVIKHQVKLTEDDISLNIIQTEMGTGKVNFDSEVIVSGGKGMQNRDAYDRLVGSLVGALREKLNVRIEKGASRAAVEQGFIDRIHQVGQTGTAVGPKLYMALGISGAIQHMIGVANTETIIAVNTDPHAPIFKQCDYYYVGDVEEVIPQLVEQLKAG
jgi:electron transfer flavoprotein alpha subunit